MRARLPLLAALTALAAAGCAGGPPSPQTGTTVAARHAPATPGASGTAVGGGDPRAADTARAFALAARAWTADTLAAQWRRQVALSTGRLRATLRRTQPLAADIQRLRADGASVTVEMLEVVPDTATAATARFVVRLREQTTAAGQVTQQVTANRVDVVRRGATWRVSAFTLAP